ncbi:hypothetical protein F3087_34095 [Nocardia colli]|uniref:Uncharacterized protein n=1 Tax=Nocardia colli TaxID=2545717 RepID=A0A5N0E494_9NOCA|nr:hypothetical protein [Nocardia colli]KAA8884257.1 hypothetical protein F3087_34095 [Nocardia colli]
MRIIRDNNPHDDESDDDRTPNEPGSPVESREPKAIGDILAAEFADYLADVVANVPEPVDPDTVPAPPRPALRLVTPVAGGPDTGDWDKPFTVENAVEAARTARRRVVRVAAGGSAVVVTAGVLAGWGEPLIVTGPLAVYGTGWLAYLWWNAALRPSIGQVLSALTGAIRSAFAVVLTTLAGLAHGLIDRVDTARTRHETTRTSPAAPSA